MKLVPFLVVAAVAAAAGSSSRCYSRRSPLRSRATLAFVSAGASKPNGPSGGGGFRIHPPGAQHRRFAPSFSSLLTAKISSNGHENDTSVTNGSINGIRDSTAGAMSRIIDASDEGEDRSERFSLDISKTIYISSIKSPKDAYIAFAEKGASNAKMSAGKILHQSILAGSYVGFGCLLALTIAGNLAGVQAAGNAGLLRMTFASLLPVNLLLIVTTGGQLFTGNTASVTAAKLEGYVSWKELWTSWMLSLLGNVLGGTLLAWCAWYTGLLVGGTANLCTTLAVTKCCASTWGQTLVKAIMCNWIVSLAIILAGASNDMVGKLVATWFPASTFIAIGLEHSVTNFVLMPAAWLIQCSSGSTGSTASAAALTSIGAATAATTSGATAATAAATTAATTTLSIGQILWRNLIPVCLGNALAGALIVATSYSYQYGRLGSKNWRARLAAYERLMRQKRRQRQRLMEAGK